MQNVTGWKQTFLEKNKTSPDLNTTESLCQDLKMALQRCPPSKLTELKLYSEYPQVSANSIGNFSRHF